MGKLRMVVDEFVGKKIKLKERQFETYRHIFKSTNFNSEEFLQEMPPKKRGRPAKAIPKLVVPPKKRKAIFETLSTVEAKDEETLIPEWLKVSIQILLINFHHEGVALLNGIQTEYEDVFKNKINPREYNFPDWESMLKSPQCKKHFFVYTDKKIPYVKGYPLPRSAVLNMIGQKWEIDPRIEKREDVEEEIKTKVQKTSKPEKEVKISSPVKPTQSQPEKHVVLQQPATIIPIAERVKLNHTETPSIPSVNIPAASASSKTFHSISSQPVVEVPKTPKKNTDFANSKPPRKKFRFSYSNPEDTPVTPVPPVVIAPSNSSADLHNPIKVFPSLAKAKEQLLNRNISQKKDKVEKVVVNNEEKNNKDSQSSFDASHFFRRSNVPPTWTDIKLPLDDEDKETINEFDNKIRKIREVIEEADLVIDESPRNSTADSAASPETERFSPPPPTLSPQDWIVENRESVIKSKQIKSNSKKQSKKPAKEIKEKNSIRRISDSTDCTGENSDSSLLSVHGSDSSSNTDDSSTQQKESKLNTGPNETAFCEWFIKKAIIPEVDINYIHQLKRCLPQEGSIMNLDRDPRLSFGFRAKFYFEQELNEDKKVTEQLDVDSETKTEIESNNEQEFNLKLRDEPLTSSEYASLDYAYTNEKMNNISMMPATNLTITIVQNHDLRKIEASSRPAINIFKNGENFNIRNTIPQDDYDMKSLKFSDLWNNMKWKNRFDADGGDAGRFFNSNIFEKWRELMKQELTTYRQDLISELQKYEDKPYPSRCEYFLRSSLRMVECNHLTDGQFSEPRLSTGENLVLPDEILYYVDFAGAPGAVIEFYNKNRKLSSKGFGVTYQKRSYDLYAIPNVVPEFFEPFYGKLNSFNGDGSLFCSDTVQMFISKVMAATQNRGVHIVTTIGNVARVAFEDDNDSKWKYQHLAQIMVALQVLREDGHMAFKMYDIKTSFTAGLLYILYRCFKFVQVTKLNIFGPTSGERAVICLGRKSTDEISEIIKYLQECHKVMADWYSKDKFSKNKLTIEELIPYSVLSRHEDFIEYLRDSNERIKKVQMDEFLVSTKNLRSFGSIFSKGLYRSLVAKTTELWKVGNRPNFAPKRSRHPPTAFKELRLYPEAVCEAVEAILNEYNLYRIFASVQKWRFLPVGNKSKTRGFYLGVDGLPHFFNTKYKEWVPVRENEFRLPSGTLVYGEIVSVFTVEKKHGDELFTIIDAMVLAGHDIRNLPYCQRIAECEKFSLAATKVFFPRMTRLTVTTAYEFSKLPDFLSNIESLTPSLQGTSTDNTKEIKSLIMSVESVFNMNLSEWKDRWFNPSGVLFFEDVNCSKDSDFCSSLFSRVYWEWVPEMDLPLPKIKTNIAGISDSSENSNEDPRPFGSVSAKKLIDFVNRYRQ